MRREVVGLDKQPRVRVFMSVVYDPCIIKVYSKIFCFKIVYDRNFFMRRKMVSHARWVSDELDHTINGKIHETDGSPDFCLNLLQKRPLNSRLFWKSIIHNVSFHKFMPKLWKVCLMKLPSSRFYSFLLNSLTIFHGEYIWVFLWNLVEIKRLFKVYSADIV